MSGRILFVDDEPPIRELLALFFRKRGFEVMTAVTIAEGRKLLGQNTFDAAILDVNLAGENGLELLNYIRKKDGALPVVIFTGLTGDPKLLEKAMTAGANGFARKTDTLQQLFDEVCRHIPSSVAARAHPDKAVNARGAKGRLNKGPDE